jgi:hypothetical protein
MASPDISGNQRGVGGGPSDQLNGGRGGRVVVLTGEPRWWQRAEQGAVRRGGRRSEKVEGLSATHTFVGV